MRVRAYRRAPVALLLTVSLVGACTGDNGSETNNEATRNTSSTEIAIETTGGDSYKWSEKIIGRADCEDVALQVNGAAVEAPIELNGTSFTVDVPVRSGDNEVVAVCADGSASDPIMFRQRLSYRPTARIDIDIANGVVRLDARKSERAVPDGSRLVEYSWTAGALHEGLRSQGQLRLENGGVFRHAKGKSLRLTTPTRSGEYFVTLKITDAEGLSDTSATYFVVEEGTARTVDMMTEHPAWIDSAVVYAPIPQLWGNGGPKAVERNLSYLRDLGVDALWLWPPTTLRTAGEEYAIEDYFEIDPSWGPKPALKSMVDKAHRLGMYVLVDFVANHMSAEGPYFQESESEGRLSHYWDFFNRRDGEYTHYFDWTNLPNLNYDSAEVRNMIMESTSYWVRDIGVDGFRMDAVWGVKRRRPDYWPQWRREIKRINPDVLLIAEASATDPYYFSHGFDVAYDWTRELGQWAWASAFEFPEEAGALLQDALTNGGKGYSPNAQILRFLNNNDTGIRFVDQHGAKMTRVAATLQFTLPGTPAMFAGDEIGASYEPYSNLTRIRWRDEHGLRPHYDRLIELKHSVAALNTRAMELLKLDSNGAVAFIRPAPEGGSPILVVTNFGGGGRIRLSGSPDLGSLVAGGTMRDLLTGKAVEVAGGAGAASIMVPAETSYVLTPGDI